MDFQIQNPRYVPAINTISTTLNWFLFWVKNHPSATMSSCLFVAHTITPNAASNQGLGYGTFLRPWEVDKRGFAGSRIPWRGINQISRYRTTDSECRDGLFEWTEKQGFWRRADSMSVDAEASSFRGQDLAAWF
jgi:hypothetical protein